MILKRSLIISNYSKKKVELGILKDKDLEIVKEAKKPANSEG